MPELRIRRSRHGLGACILPLLLSAVAPAQVNWTRVTSFSYAWVPNAKPVEFTLEIPEPWDRGGDYARIHIQVPGRSAFNLTTEGGWGKYDSGNSGSSFPSSFRKSNLLDNDYVLFAPAEGDDRVLAILFGWGYGSSPGSLDVIELAEDGSPRVFLHKTELDLKDLRDLDGDGTSEIVGRPCLSQKWGNGLLTYDPLQVYRLSRTRGGKAALSLPLSRAYNLAHYYGWSGPECSEDIAVVLHPRGGGKPQLMSAKDAKALTEPPKP